MRNSLKLGKIAGIPVGLHWTVGFIALLLTVTLTSGILPSFAPGFSFAIYLSTAIAVGVLFLASIVAHEFGHALVAQRHGVGVNGITLFALGGVAQLESEAPDAGAAGKIALAGPLVSVIIGAATIGASFLFGLLGLPSVVVAGLFWLGIVNVALAVFNMIPALPLDGGRVLQAWLWKRDGHRDEATVKAFDIGRWFAFALIGFGVWSILTGGTGFMTALIGWFVLAQGKAEAFRAKQRIRLERWSQQRPWFMGPIAGSPFAGSPRATHPSGHHPFGTHPFTPTPMPPPPAPAHVTVIDTEARRTDQP